MKSAFILLALSLLTGCASLVMGTSAQQYAAKGVNKYCTEYPYAIRADVIRPEFTTLISPHQAIIACCGDPENTNPACDKPKP